MSAPATGLITPCMAKMFTVTALGSGSSFIFFSQEARNNVTHSAIVKKHAASFNCLNLCIIFISLSIYFYSILTFNFLLYCPHYFHSLAYNSVLSVTIRYSLDDALDALQPTGWQLGAGGGAQRLGRATHLQICTNVRAGIHPALAKPPVICWHSVIYILLFFLFIQF